MKIFFSSTCDNKALKSLRNETKELFKRLNYEVLLSDAGDLKVRYPGIHTQTACIKEVEKCDIMVHLIGREWGGKLVPEAYDELKKIIAENQKRIYGGVPSNMKFFKFLNPKKREISIAQAEYIAAYAQNIPVFVFLHKEMEVFLKNYKVAVKNKEPIMTQKICQGKIKQNDVEHILGFLHYITRRETDNAYIQYHDKDSFIEMLTKELAKEFQRLASEERKKLVSQDLSLYHSRILKSRDSQRSDFFDSIFKEAKDKEPFTIKILGTGLTSFLGDLEKIEGYLERGNTIQIISMNDEIVKEAFSCKNALPKRCWLDAIKFIIEKEHFIEYHDRPDYLTKMAESRDKISNLKKETKVKKWAGSISDKNFNSFVPISITAVTSNAKNTDFGEMVVEFLIPFTSQRIQFKFSYKEHNNIYTEILSFYDMIWNKKFGKKLPKEAKCS